MQFSEDDDLSQGLASSSKKASQISLIKDYMAIMASADNPTPAGRASSFLSINGSKIQVEFELIATRLRRRILEATTRERHGDDGVRIVNLLLSSGKMDEKQVSFCRFFDCVSQRNSSSSDLQNRYDGSERRAAFIDCDGSRLHCEPAGGAEKR